MNYFKTKRKTSKTCTVKEVRSLSILSALVRKKATVTKIKAMTITETEIDDWVAKAEAVQQAIRGIAEGNDVNLEAFGIFNQNVEVLEDYQQREVLDKNCKDLGAKRQIDQDQERLLWWDEAKRRFGSVGVSAVAETSPRTVALPIPVNVLAIFSSYFSLFF